MSSLPSVHSQRVLCPPPPGRNSKQRNNSSNGCASTVDGKTKSSSISSSTASASSASTNRVDVAGLRLDLPVDDDDYLVPSPQTPGNPMQQPQQQQHLSMLRRQQQLQQHQHQHPRSPGHTNPYMDLLSADQQNKGSSSASSTQKAQPGQTMFPYPPPQGYFLTGN